MKTVSNIIYKLIEVLANMYSPANSVEEIIRLATETHDKLCQQSDLSPKNQTVNLLLARLVGFVTQDYSPADAQRALTILNEKGIVPKLRRLCYEAECQIEEYYLEKYYSSINAQQQINASRQLSASIKV